MRTIREDYALAYRYARIYSRYALPSQRLDYHTRCLVSHISNIVAGNAWQACSMRLDGYITNIFDRLYDRLVARYEAQIRADFEFKELTQEAREHFDLGMGWDDDNTGRAFIGTVFDVMPSGKYHTAWACGNVSEIEQFKDQCFSEALDNVAESFGGWVESGEGDPCDLFFCKSYED